MIPVLHGVWATSTSVLPPVSGYRLWLDASDGSTFTFSSGTSVSEWRDKSTNAYVFQQNTAANQPSRSGTKNSLSTVVFDGSNDYLVSTAAASTWKFLSDGSGATTFTVLLTPSSSVVDFYLSTAANSSLIGIANYVNTTGAILGASSSNGVAGGANIMYAESAISPATSTWYVHTAKYDQNNGTVANRVMSYTNAGAAATNAANKTPSTANPSYTLYIGTLAEDPTTYAFGGNLAEILIYPSVLNDTDRAAVRDYLNTKWAVY